MSEMDTTMSTTTSEVVGHGNAPVIPHPGNPEHVANLASISLLEAQGFEGSDCDLATSLFEYGMAWRDLDNGELLVIYRHPRLDGRFDRCAMLSGIDCKREWNWVKWN